MPQLNFRSVALQVFLFFVGATCSFCANPGDLSVKSLLQKGIDRRLSRHGYADPVG